MTTLMSLAVEGIQAAWGRIEEIRAQVAPPAPAPTPADFATALASARAPAPAATLPAALPAAGAPVLGQVQAAYIPSAMPAATTGQRIADIATAELGVAEAPLGSNDGARIAEYRTATAGAAVGPWCAYFTSWVAAQAGVPIGDGGRGLGYVPTVQSWAQANGRYLPGGAGSVPAVGDLAIFDRDGDGTPDHIGVVRAVGPDGGFTTIEGNSSDAVSPRVYEPGGATGFVRLG